MTTMANDNLNLVSREQAKRHLFTKEKYDVLLSLWPKIIPLLQRGSEKVTFYVGKEQRSYPANLVKSLSNIRVNAVRIESERYNIQEVETLMDMLINLPTFVCSGIFTDYTDWKSISSLVNIMELAEHFGMVEVKTFLERIRNLLTEYNKNAFEVEFKRRMTKKEENKNLPVLKEMTKESDHSTNRGRSKSRSRRKSLSGMIRRSLSRGRKYNED